MPKVLIQINPDKIPQYIRKLKLQEKAKKAKKQPPYPLDYQKMANRKLQKQKTIEQKIKQVKLNGAELQALEKAYSWFKPNFDWRNLRQVLLSLDMKLNKSEIELMIWQVDQNLDKKVSFQQFKSMYIRCIMDQSGLQIHDLFHLTQFLMYCKPKQHWIENSIKRTERAINDKQKSLQKNNQELKITITVEDTLKLIYVRVKQQSEKNPSKGLDDKSRLKQQIKAIFGSDESEARITFGEYLEKMRERIFQKRKKIEQNKKAKKYLTQAFKI